MVVGKWNYEKRDYEPYRLPDSWKCKSYSGDMTEIINCAQCGREITVGEAYSSVEIQIGFGFGYMVCGSCAEEERGRRCRKENRK